MTERETRARLEHLELRPSRKLGQNFLVDENLARWIVGQLELAAGDTVVEVGPGLGALSEHVVGQVRKLILIEFDARLAQALQERYRGDEKVSVIHADGARFDPRVLWKYRPVKFLGNLPYSAGGAIMRNFLSHPNPFARAVLMLQKEVGERLRAAPRGKDYGVLTLRMGSVWRIAGTRTVGPDVFHPRPRIDSMVLALEPLVGELGAFDARRFDELIRRGFSQRRKQLRKLLPAGPPDWEDVTRRMGWPVQVRAEELSLADWAELARIYDPLAQEMAGQSGEEIFDVVDESDRVIGQATRDAIHAGKLRHRAAHVFLLNKRGEILLQKRSLLKDGNQGLWDSSVAGHLDHGEDYHTAARREMAEEMGVEDCGLELLGMLPPKEQTGWEHIAVFRGDWDGRVRYPCAEVAAVLWLPPAEIDAWLAAQPRDFAEGFVLCWQLFRSKGGG